MPAPMFDLRFEVAFSTDPDSASPAWVDLTSRVHLPSGITNRRGRGDEFDTSQPGTLQLSAENIDGALSPDNPSSPYYPNVLPRRRCRLTYRNSNTIGTRNMMPADSATFEGGTVGSWVTPSTVNTTLANDTLRAADGTKSLRVTANGIYSGPLAQVSVPGLVIGRTYTARARVYVPSGVPNMLLSVFSVGNGSSITTKDVFGTSTVTWTATQNTHILGVGAGGSGFTASGQQIWIDAVQVDEGSSLNPVFSIATASSATLSRFDGYLDEWPVEWPNGGDTYSRAQLTAGDLLVRLGQRKALRSVVVETSALDGAVVHFPLGEPSGSTQARSVAGDAAVLYPVTVGNGASLTFATGTGVPTDGNSAPTWSSSAANGTLLQSRPNLSLNYGRFSGYQPGPITVVANITTTGTGTTAVAVSDTAGISLSIGVDGTGKAIANLLDASIGRDFTITSTATINDGKTHHVAASLAADGFMTLVVDGVTVTGPSPSGAATPVFQILTIGGLTSGARLFSGVVSHVAVHPSVLTTAQLLVQRQSTTTGFAGERSDQRIARLATWAGLPAARLNLDVGNTNVAHIDPTGSSPLEYLRKVEAAEGGNLFAAGDGRLTFHNRARSYTPRAADVTLPSPSLGESIRVVKNLAQVVNDVTGSRTGGALVRQVDAASQAAYGQLSTSLDLAVTTDDEVADAVNWRLSAGKSPLTRFTDLPLDIATDATYRDQILLLVDVGARVAMTGMPSQAPSASMTQQVQGYTETITDTTWALSVNATPFDHLSGLILDDATYGVLDANNRIVY